MNAQETVLIRQCLLDLGHLQPPTPLVTDNSTAKGVITGEMKQKMAKTFDMQCNWIKNCSANGHIDVQWESGKTNMADYHSKRHPPTHCSQVRRIYLNTPDSPASMQGCAKILCEAHEPRKYHSSKPTSQPFIATAA